MKIQPEIDGVSVVLLGSINPAIFTPAWFVLHELLPKNATDTATLQVAHPQVTRFVFDWLTLQVTTDQFVADTAQAPHVRVRRPRLARVQGTPLPYAAPADGDESQRSRTFGPG